MAAAYLFRKSLVQRILSGLDEGPVVVWGPPGFGKTLLLLEVARELGVEVREEYRGEPGVYDLGEPPPRLEPGQVVASRRRPTLGAKVVALGPAELAFTPAEVRELARRAGARRLADEAFRELGGWPALTRRGLEAGEVRAAREPVRGLIEGMLAGLGEGLVELLHSMVLGLPEAAYRSWGRGQGVDELLRGGWAEADEHARLRPLPALAAYLMETRGRPPFSRVAPLLEASLESDPEAALEGLIGYRRPEAGRAFELAAEKWLLRGEFERVVRVWRALPEDARTSLGAIRAAEAERSRGNLEEALSLARWASRDPRHRALARNVEGTVLIHLGRYADAARAFEAALREADDELRGKVSAGLGAALIRAGRYRKAVTVLQLAAQDPRVSDDPETLARVHHNLGIALHHSGELLRALSAYRMALELKAKQGPLTQANTLLSLGEALRLLGRFEEAHRVLKEAWEKAKESEEYRAVAYSALNLGDLYVEAGWLEEAQEAYLEAERALSPTGDRYGEGLLHLGRARLYRSRGALALAEVELRRAEEALSSGGSPAELAAVWLERARVLPAEAARWVREAEAAAREVGDAWLLAVAGAEAVLLGSAGGERACAVAEFALADGEALLLDLRYLPVWAQAGCTAGRAALEKLAQGTGTARVYTLGETRILRDREVKLPTAKEYWLLIHLWVRPDGDPRELFAGSRRPEKRLQVGVHHLRRALGEDWVRRRGDRYLSSPLPGVWWDAGLFEAASRQAHLPPVRELARALYRGPFAPGAPFEEERLRYARLAEGLAPG